MSSVTRKLSLLEDVARLRRAQARLPRDPDLAKVRLDLERELGETVSKRMAARLLGVSHAALAPWVEAGDLPTVFTPEGRNEVPVPALLDLYERVSEGRRRGGRRLHVIEPEMREARDRAARMPVDELTGTGAASGHEAAEHRGLAYHRAVAKRLDRQMVDEAWYRIYKWRELDRLDPRYADQWQAILERPLDEVRRAIAEEGPTGNDLRQSSPFAGMLSEPERRKLLQVA